MPMRIRGTITFKGAIADISGAVVFVRIVDVSLADAAACTLSEYRVSLSSRTNTSTKIPFELDVNIIDTRRSYTITAHVDLDGDGKISVGDYITMQSFPVRGDSLSPYYLVEVRRVEG